MPRIPDDWRELTLGLFVLVAGLVAAIVADSLVELFALVGVYAVGGWLVWMVAGRSN